MRLALAKLRTGPRLFLSFLLVLAVMGLIVWIAIGRLHALNAMAENLVHDKLAKQQRAADWLGAVSLNGTRAMAIARSDSLELEDYFRGRLQGGDRLIDELRAGFHGDSADEQALLTAIKQQHVAYQKLRTRIFELKSVGKIQDVERLAGTELEPAFERYTGAIRALLDHEKQQAAVLAVESAQAYRASRMTLMALGGLTLGLGILFAWLLTRGIVRPLQHAVAVAQKIAQGQLGTEIRNERQDEIGQLLNALQTMNSSLAVTIRSIDHEANVITAAASQMVERNADLSLRTETQAVTLEQTASSIEQVTTAIRQNAEHAGHARQLAESAAELAGRGGQDIAEVVSTMKRMKKDSSEVAQITGVIDGLAFQTNILALNAAVEAARAGAQGRSFAVVAAEVRTLAHRSAAAAKDINGLIDGLIRQIHHGDRLTATAGKTMQQIVGSSRQVADIVSDITLASEQQSIAIAQANGAVSEMERATQHNAAFVEQSAGAAENLQRQAFNLRHAVDFFTLAANTSRPASRTAPAAPNSAASGQPSALLSQTELVQAAAQAGNVPLLNLAA